jgi:hypothetical protein
MAQEKELKPTEDGQGIGAPEFYDSDDKDKELKDRINKDFKFAFSYWQKYRKETKEDLFAALGEQWKAEDLQKLAERGVKGLTINKIKPNITLLLGIESQNRTDFTAYPIGAEDEAKGEITTRLLKDLMKKCMSDMKISDNFQIMITEGNAYIKPYIDYSRDLINGDLRLRVKNSFCIFVDPDSVEYDLSDAKFIYELISGLTKDEVKELYPDKAAEIDACQNGVIDLSEFGQVSESSRNVGADNYKEPDLSGVLDGKSQKIYDLIEYHYKKWVEKYYVADRVAGTIEEYEDKAEAEKSAASKAVVDEFGGITNNARVIKRYVPEIWTAVLLGKDIVLQNQRAWSYPRYKGYPIIPEFAFRYPAKLPDGESKSHLRVAGLPRDIRDLNFEYNKRRTQELHILNTSANSGWLMEENSVPDEKAYSEFGATPGVVLKYKKGRKAPQKITPTQLSQGHSQIASETGQDIKEATGINTDLLAMNENQASGRAIAIRQRQGMVMVQKLFDNHSQTKQLLGRFLLSQLGEVYDIDTAIRVLGAAFMLETFGEDTKAGFEGINQILNDTQDQTKYDVVVGESAQSETVKIANYLTLTEMIEKGVPIPPDVLVEESFLPQSTKKKIKAIIEAAQQQQQAAAGMPVGPAAAAQPQRQIQGQLPGQLPPELAVIAAAGRQQM